MKLIIDIPEETVKNCKSVNWSNIRYDQVDDMELVIANGTPLGDIKAEIDKQSDMHMDGEFYIRNIDVKRILSGKGSDRSCQMK